MTSKYLFPAVLLFDLRITSESSISAHQCPRSLVEEGGGACRVLLGRKRARRSPVLSAGARRSGVFLYHNHAPQSQVRPDAVTALGDPRTPQEDYGIECLSSDFS